MEANNFIAKIKAEGTNEDVYDLTKVNDEFKTILSNLGNKEKVAFSLNVLCILCRNLDKVPMWRDRVDPKALLILSIECVRETRTSPKPDQVKTLACIYHIHKHIVKMKASPPPELVLKLCYMPFDCTLLEEYAKTYWNLLADRMSYIDKLKAKSNITKLLPRLTDDAVKVLKIYDTVQFCTNILIFLVKKLHYLYNESNYKDLHKCFGEILKEIQIKVNGESFETLKGKELLDLYVKFNDCFYVIAENGSKCGFRDCILDSVVATAVKIIGHNTDILKCIDMFLAKGFCYIFTNTTNVYEVQNTLHKILNACINSDLNEKVLLVTYPFLNQFIRLYIEYIVTNESNWKYFDIKIQYTCLNLIFHLSSKKTEQFLKCDNCKVKSSLHDSLRLLFLIKHFPSLSTNQNINITPILPIYYKLVTIQHKILYELRKAGCANHEKCFRKLQTDIHNTAILLNKATYYEYSLKLFQMYVEYEIMYFKNESDLKNICRALYNKSICELDFKLYDEALKDAFLSLVFSLPDGLGTEKYMSLVMDIKAKELKKGDDDENHDSFQLLSVVEACSVLLEEKKYGNLKPFLTTLKFSELLKHEFTMYARLWPSIMPIAGVWRSLRDLLNNKYISWAKVENPEDILWTLYEVVLDTPNVVRTIHTEYYCEVVSDLIERFDSVSSTTELKFIQATLLFLKAEYDLAEAGQKYGWKITEPSMDPDQMGAVRTLPQEHTATKKALEAVDLLTKTVNYIKSVPVSKHLRNSLQVYQVWIQQFLHLDRTLHALQLSHICLQVATHVSDAEGYLKAASTILSHANRASDQVMRILTTAVDLWSSLGEDCSCDALVFLCCAAIYYNKCGSPGVAARLIQMVQAKILVAYEKNPDVNNMELAVGRLLEAQSELCAPSAGAALSAVSNAQRHYLAVPNTASKWSARRLTSLTLKSSISRTGLASCHLCRSLRLQRRTRGACAVSLPASAACAQAALLAAAIDTNDTQHAQTRIDNRLKHILGLQPSNETQEHKSDPDSKPHLFTPRLEQVETMLECVVFKKTQSSPSLSCTSVFAYKMPDFFRHTKCDCYACDNPNTIILSCLTSGIESANYFRAQEKDIARNYFEGTLKTFGYGDAVLKSYFKKYRSKFEGYVVDIVEKVMTDDFKNVQIEVLIEAAFFELSQKMYEQADELIVMIHDLMQDLKNINPYLKNEIMNLMITSSQLRKVIRKQKDISLELEMENLKINVDEEPKTPVTKMKNPPKMTKVIVKDDELPNIKRKVIKLNLDDVAEETVKKPIRRKAEFKIPVPVTKIPVIENITPRPRSKPDIIVTRPDDKETPKDKSEFYTPISTPAEQFFTPMTSFKTYSKKSLRSNIVKKLEAEFSTPKGGKENSTVSSEVERLELPKRGRAKVGDRKTLKRATSPGALVTDVKTRSRLKNPSNINK